MEGEEVSGSKIPRELQTCCEYGKSNQLRISSHKSDRAEQNEEVVDSRPDYIISLVRLVEEQAILISLHSSQAFMMVSLMSLLAVEECSCELQEYGILKPIYWSVLIDLFPYNADVENQ